MPRQASTLPPRSQRSPCLFARSTGGEHSSRRDLPSRAEAAGTAGQSLVLPHGPHAGTQVLVSRVGRAGSARPRRRALPQPMRMRMRHRRAPPMAEAAARLTEPLRSPPPPHAAGSRLHDRAQATPSTPLPAAPADAAPSDATTERSDRATSDHDAAPEPGRGSNTCARASRHPPAPQPRPHPNAST